MITGLYESLITQSLDTRLKQLPLDRFYINRTKVDSEEAVRFLSLHLHQAITRAFNHISDAKKALVLEKQIEISNQIIRHLHAEISQYPFTDDLLDTNGEILKAVFGKVDNDYVNLDLRLKEITPASRLTQSELFTGGNVGISLDSELKKEIRSADRIDLLVSFIKWKAIVILKEALSEFTQRGGQLRIITTTYMGATDAKAIQELAALPNTEVKVSYNQGNERLHAKAYLFYRNTGFHTAYIGSSNFSRSALTDGLEWNVKVTTKEIPHIIDKFQKTFTSYWQNPEFEQYSEQQYETLHSALQRNRVGKGDAEVFTMFDVKTYHYQAEILEKLKVEREVHGRYRNLVVAATGTGKTIVSAFDFKQHIKHHPETRLLFIAHRIEILKQARNTYRNILKDQDFGELLGQGYELSNRRHVFATIQTLVNRIKDGEITPDYYDYIVLDEVHHAQATTYQQVIQFFKPKILLGLTATPERADGKSILGDFDERIAAEIRLPDALNNKILCPFQYFAISDSVDLDQVKWVRGKYDAEELNSLYTGNNQRVGEVIHNINRYCRDIHEVRALGFCITIEHASFMQRKFAEAGFKAGVLTSEQSHDRATIIQQFRKREINYLFVVDIFNEGIDIPEIDTVLFLRPTESLTIFLQQLGRGLRLHDSKDCLTVLDFVGNAHVSYDFEMKFRALIGKTNTTVEKEIEHDFMHLPLGCSIVLEKKAKEVILANIRKATNMGKRNLLAKVQQFVNHTHLPLTLANFLYIYQLNIKKVYRRITWSALCYEANKLNSYDDRYEQNYRSMLCNKWAATNSLSYFKFLLYVAEQNFDTTKIPHTEENELMLCMLHYDFWKEVAPDASLASSIAVIGQNETYVQEIKEYLSYRIDQIDFEEIECPDLGYAQPLRLHARYTRDQILVAFRLSTLQKKSSNREGVAENKSLSTEILFINLQKSEEDFSPTTLYDDYAINEMLFHWQSQNDTADTSPKGQSYINHEVAGKQILLFIRESKKDSYDNTNGYVFVGPVQFQSYQGSKPMSITWQLEEPIPEYLWQESAKMAVG